jgi:hypothetical protein
LPVAEAIEADQFRRRSLEAHLRALNLAEPAVGLGFLDSVIQVGDDLGKSWSCSRVEPEARAADAGFSELKMIWNVMSC